jgi:RNA recognition motif-containing protein
MSLFAPYGELLGVYAKKTYKMKGQGFIVFKDLKSASEAMRCLQKTPFFGQELHIHYAKDRSDLVAKLEGNLDPTLADSRKQRREEELKHLSELKAKRRVEMTFEQPKEPIQSHPVPAVVVSLPERWSRTKRVLLTTSCSWRS